MENQEDIFSKGIGNIEQQSLKAKPVVVVGKLVEDVMGKIGGKNAGKLVGKKLVIMAKHPDKEEVIKISSVKILKGDTVTSVTMWVTLDSDGNLQKGSAIARILEQFNVKTLNELEGKTIQTDLDKGGYLCIKAY